jgi:hypothetical protein
MRGRIFAIGGAVAQMRAVVSRGARALLRTPGCERLADRASGAWYRRRPSARADRTNAPPSSVRLRVPSPLYGIHREPRSFSPLVTLVYAICAFGVLTTLILAGRFSDDVGGRPVLLVALGVRTGSTMLLIFAGHQTRLVNPASGRPRSIVDGCATRLRRGAQRRRPRRRDRRHRGAHLRRDGHSRRQGHLDELLHAQRDHRTRPSDHRRRRA